MTPDIPDIFQEIAAATTLNTGEFLRSYDNFLNEEQKEKTVTKHIETTSAQLVFAGTRACALAFQILTTHKDERGKGWPLLANNARCVLKDWGIDATEVEGDAASAIPPLPKEPQDEVLRWPPPAPSLGSVYQTHEYIVREDCVGQLGDGDTYWRPDAAELALTKNTVLIFDGHTCFTNDGHWIMRMRCEHLLQAGERIWIRASKVKPGGEL